MQIVSEAIFQHLKEPTLLYASSHNKIAFVTQNELVLKEIAFTSKQNALKIKGNEVIALSLENPYFLVILYSRGLLEVRKIQKSFEIVFSVWDILIQDNNAKLRVTCEAIYILSYCYVQKISFKREIERQEIYYEGERINDVATDILISDVLQQQKIMLFQFNKFITFNIWGIPITKLNFQHLSQIKILKNPLMILEKSREFLLVIENNRYLKVYDIFTLEQILEMTLHVQRQEKVEMKIDPLNEYMILRVFNKENRTIRNNLLKINKEYYLGQSDQSFFLFDLQLGIAEDLILFPTHEQTIKGNKFHSIDMLFLTPKYIKIATLVVDINHRTKLRNVKHMDLNWKSVDHWQEIISNLKSSCQTDIAPKQETKKPDIQFKEAYLNSEMKMDSFINKFLQESYQSNKADNVKFHFDKVGEKTRYLESGLSTGAKYLRQKMQHQDGLNTLSGSSSFRSIDSATYQLQQKLLKIIQKDFLSQEEHPKDQKSCLQIKEQLSIERDFQSSQQDFDDIDNSIHEAFQLSNEKMNTVSNKMNRFQSIFLNKGKKVQRRLRHHTKQLLKIEKMIPQICEQEMKSYTAQINESLTHFKSIISRIEIMGTRNLKKIKKKYKDFLNEQIQNCTQRLQESETSSAKVQNLMKRLGTD